MKILYYFMQYPTPMYLWQNTHIVDELSHHDIEVLIFNPLDYSSMDEANEQVIKHMRKNRYDLFMTCNISKVCYPSTISKVKEMGIPTLLICFDSLMTPLKHKDILPYFDLVMISQNDDKNIFRKSNSNVLVSHYAANPHFFRPVFDCEKINRVAFPGTPYGSRARIISNLIQNKVPVDLYYGNGKAKIQQNTSNHIDFEKKWKTIMELVQYPVGRKVLYASFVGLLKKDIVFDGNTENLFLQDAVDLKATNQIYASHDLSLSISIARNTGNIKYPIHIVHLRNFEIPMSGGVQFCEYFDELSECFEEDKEIIFYRSYDEMIEKARFYLKPEHKSIRQDIRKNARKRAENEHTWFCRFSRAFDFLGLKF